VIQAKIAIILDGELYGSTERSTAINVAPETKELWLRERLKMLVDKMKEEGAFDDKQVDV
jgi:hypothetical protein